MLVSRQYDTESSHWPFNKYDPISRKSTASRMSNHYDTAVSAPSDWRGQYPYLEQGEASIFSQPFGQNGNDNKSSSHSVAGSESNSLSMQLKEEPASPRSQVFRSSPLDKTASMVQDDTETSRSIGSMRADSPIRSGTYRLSLSLDSVPSTCHGSEVSSSHTGPREKSTSPKDDDEIVFDDDEAMDVDGDGMTAAERTAARRKMKRFRLTHQQTRFLMSEFAKQPHPDAAHRERLSREIPGLSPRQVQVWFQNRRAKIKRLTVDDRDRMIKMRAVPDDFDNVQALHSPYGAVHGLGAHMASPLEFGSQSYAEHMIRPLMIDVRRSDRPTHLPPTGLAQGYGNLGFGSNMMSPLSSGPHDRYPYTSPLSTPPLTGGLPTSNPFERQNGMDATNPLHPLHLRDPSGRPRAETMLSPLRTGMSWKSDTMDYAYQGTNTSPNMAQRQQPAYQSPFDSTTFPGSAAQSPTSPVQSPGRRTRFRPASSTVTVNYEFRNSFRSLSPSGAPRLTLQTSQSNSAPVYSTSYPTAPLTAPVDFSPQKTSDSRMGMPEWPEQFPQAFQNSQTSRTPVATSFGNGFGSGQQNSDSRMSGIDMHQRKRSLTLPTNSSRSFFNP